MTTHEFTYVLNSSNNKGFHFDRVQQSLTGPKQCERCGGYFTGCECSRHGFRSSRLIHVSSGGNIADFIKQAPAFNFPYVQDMPSIPTWPLWLVSITCIVGVILALFS